MKSVFQIASGGIAFALLAGAFVALRPRPLEVDVAKVVRAPLEQRVVDDGLARIREKYTVSAPVTGTLARIDWHEGDLIEPGAVLARLLPLASPLRDPESQKAAEQHLAAAVDAAEQAKASVARAQALRDQASADRERTEGLASHGALSASEVDRANVDLRTKTADLASAKFAASVAEHDIAEARATLSRFKPGAASSEQFEITSPVHGQVLHVLKKSEGVVAAGTPLLEVGDPRALELVADVLSQDAVAIRPGMPARVVRWGGEQQLGAKVRLVEPAAFTKTSALGVDEQRVNALLDLDAPADHWRGLGDGFAVEIEITTWSKPDVTQVPTSALFRDGPGWSVFVVHDDHAHTKRVEPGHRGPLATEISAGLAPGDLVVIHPGAALRDGSRVSYRAE